MKLKLKRNREPMEMRIVHDFRTNITHEVKHLPKPKPNMIYGEVRNDVGEVWRMQSQVITGQAIMPVNVPLGFLTGRPDDHSKQVQILFHMEY